VDEGRCERGLNDAQDVTKEEMKAVCGWHLTRCDALISGVVLWGGEGRLLDGIGVWYSYVGVDLE